MIQIVSKKRGGKEVPYLYFKESWTPLKIIGIRFFTDDEGGFWIKIWNFHRRQIIKKLPSYLRRT